jgi:putative spermidine/putrescine transport system permease protein
MPLPANATTSERVTQGGARAFAALVLAFLMLPMFVIVPLSFTSGAVLIYPLPGWSLRWYDDFFFNPLWTGALRNSLVIGSLTTVLATSLGTVAALGLNASRSRLKPLLFGLLVTPMVVPVVITAVALFYLFSALGLSPGMVLGHTVIASPFTFVTVSATLQVFDPNLPRAAAVLGAPPHVVFRRITLPLIWPGLLSGALFAFAASFDELVISLFLSSPELRTLPRQIFGGVSESISPTVAAAAVVLALVSTGLMLVVELLRRRALRVRLAVVEGL